MHDAIGPLVVPISVFDSTEVHQQWGFVRLWTERLPQLRRAGHAAVIPAVVFDEHWGQVEPWYDKCPLGPAGLLSLPELSSTQLDVRLRQAREVNLAELLHLAAPRHIDERHRAGDCPYIPAARGERLNSERRREVFQTPAAAIIRIHADQSVGRIHLESG